METKYKFSYNCKGCITHIGGTKQGYIYANSKENAKIKIEKFLKDNNATLCHYWF